MFGGLFDYFFLEVSPLFNFYDRLVSCALFRCQGVKRSGQDPWAEKKYHNPGGGVEPKARPPQEKSSKNGYLQKPWRSSDLIFGAKFQTDLEKT